MIQKLTCHADYVNGETVVGKWMLAFLTKREREILREAIHRPGVYRFDEIAEVAVGIVTGANKFFLVPNSVVKQYRCPEKFFLNNQGSR